MLRIAFEEAAPYLSNINKIKEFVEDKENEPPEKIIKFLKEEIEKSEGTLKTDFRILLNEFERIINKGDVDL